MYTLKSFNTGQITLPKKRRSKYNTKNFIAEERDGGLFIKPVSQESVVYYEEKDGFGLLAPKGMDPQELISRIQELNG